MSPMEQLNINLYSIAFNYTAFHVALPKLGHIEICNGRPVAPHIRMPVFYKILCSSSTISNPS
ncbi:MAG: hypothetical protein ACTSWK_19010, partial [Promethearchaeota archaeon]